MSKFPKGEAEITALAKAVILGLGQASQDFPAPPVPVNDLQTMFDAYSAKVDATIAAESASKVEHAAKGHALETLVDALKKNLKYAEATKRGEPEKLARLGWGPPREGAGLKAPGEVRDMTVVAEGDTWAILRWNPPVDGGAVGAYKIQRKNGTGGWEEVVSTTETQLLMSNQPRGVDLSFRVLAMNKAGLGNPGATVTVVL